MPRILKLVGKAPLTTIFLVSWACGVIGLALDLRVDQGAAGRVWRNLIGPAYAASLLGTVLGIPFPLRIVVALGAVAAADYAIYTLRTRRHRSGSTEA